MSTEPDEKEIAAGSCGPETSSVTRFKYRDTGPRSRRHKFRHTVTLRSYTTRDTQVTASHEYTGEYQALDAHFAYLDTRHAGCTWGHCAVPPLQSPAPGTDGEAGDGAGGTS